MIEGKGRIGRVFWLGAFLLGTFWAGTWLNRPASLRADVRETPPKEAFLAGGERAVPILQEISATLKRIDARLAKIEKAVVPAKKP